MIELLKDNTDLEIDNIVSFMEDHNLGVSRADIPDVYRFSNGYSNLTYLFKFPASEFVLRMPPKGAVKRGHDMGREFKVLSGLNRGFHKAPKVYAFTEDRAITGYPFYIMEKVDGVILTYREAEKRKIPPGEFKTIADTWLETMIELHNLDYASVGLDNLGKPEGYVRRQVTNWSKQYLAAATMDLPDAAFVMHWMDQNQPDQYMHSLIHNDFKYDNVVFDDGDWTRIKAILDWEMCTLGDPLMDLGTSLGYWTMAADGPMLAQGLPSPTIFEGNPGRSEVVEKYAQKSGHPIKNLVFYYVYGLFKIAVIAQQIFYRYHKGLTKNKKFANLDQSCAFLCLMAKQAIQKNRIDHLF